MRCGIYEHHNPPSTADACLQLQPRTIRHEATEDMAPELSMDLSYHLAKNWKLHQNVVILIHWGHLPVLGYFLKGRMTGILQLLQTSSLAFLLILILLSWKPCATQDLHC